MSHGHVSKILRQQIARRAKKQVPLFNPRQDGWHDHFRWSDDATEIVGLTAVGRATVVALKLNRPARVAARRRWVSVGWHPPKD